MDLRRSFLERWSAALVADAAYRAGVEVRVAPAAVRPLDAGIKLAGRVVTVEANNDLVSVIAAVHRAEADRVLVIGNRTREVAVVGDLIGAEAARKGLAGLVVDAMVRDRAELRDLGLPVFSRGTVPVGPLKLAPELEGVGRLGAPVELGPIRVDPGWWAFGDGDGVIFVPPGSEEAIGREATLAEEREAALETEIDSGRALGDLLDVEGFLEERERDPDADFNRHLRRIGRAI